LNGEKIIMKRKTSIPLWIMVFAGIGVLFLAFMLYVQQEEIIKTDVENFNRGWEYSVNGTDFKDITKLPANVNNEKYNKLIIKNKLPELNETKSLMFRSSNQTVNIYIGDELIYSFGGEKVSFSKTPGSYWNFVPLSTRFSEEEIRIEMVSPYSDCAGFVSMFRMGDDHSEKMLLLQSQLINFLLCLLTGVIGIAMIMFQFFVEKHRRQYGFGYLGLFTLLMSIWSILETQIMQFFLDMPSILTVITFLSLIILPVPLLLFIKEVFYEEGNKIIDGIIIFSLVNFLIQTFFQLFSIVDYYQMVIISHLIILASVIFIVYVLVIKYIKTKYEKSSYILIATLSLFALGIIDMVRYYTGSFGDYSAAFRIGIIVFAAFMALYYSKRMEGIREKLVNVALYERLAYEDVLTGLKNRSFFEKDLRESVEEVTKNQSIYIVTFDMNDLKYNNDHFGHSIGDKLIVACGDGIKRSFIGNANICRIGGDEFAVILKGVTEEYIKASLRRLDDFVKEYNNNNFYELEIAYGYSIYDSKVDKNLESVMSRADKKMYYKKNMMKTTKKESREYIKTLTDV